MLSPSIAHWLKQCSRVFLPPSLRSWEICSRLPPKMPLTCLKIFCNSTLINDWLLSRHFSTLTWPNSTTQKKNLFAPRRSLSLSTIIRNSQSRSIGTSCTLIFTSVKRKWGKRFLPSTRRTTSKWGDRADTARAKRTDSLLALSSSNTRSNNNTSNSSTSSSSTRNSSSTNSRASSNNSISSSTTSSNSTCEQPGLDCTSSSHWYTQLTRRPAAISFTQWLTRLPFLNTQ